MSKNKKELLVENGFILISEKEFENILGDYDLKLSQHLTKNLPDQGAFGYHYFKNSASVLIWAIVKEVENCLYFVSVAKDGVLKKNLFDRLCKFFYHILKYRRLEKIFLNPC